MTSKQRKIIDEWARDQGVRFSKMDIGTRVTDSELARSLEVLGAFLGAAATVDR